METYLLHLVTMLGLSIALVAAADISLTGLGIFNVAHASFAALGAYAAAALSVHAGLSIAWGAPAGLALGAAAGIAIAVLSRRLSSNLLVIGTLCVALAISSIARNGDWITGGARGLSGVPPFLPAGTVLGNALADAVAASSLACMAAAVWTALRLGSARRLLAAVREEPLACEAWGVNPGLINAIGLGASGAIAGVAGAVYVAHLSVISPAAYSLADAFGLLSVAVLMSQFGLWGGIGGAAWLVLAPEALALTVPTSSAVAAIRKSLLAALLPIVLLFGAARGPRAPWKGSDGGKADPAPDHPL